jgi:hypothetical protein
LQETTTSSGGASLLFLEKCVIRLFCQITTSGGALLLDAGYNDGKLIERCEQ